MLMLLLMTVCFTLAIELQLHFVNQRNLNSQPPSFLQVLFGDARSLLAQQFFIQADVTLHGGYYPSVFDQTGSPQKLQIAAADKPDASPDRKSTSDTPAKADYHDLPEFLSEPRNWIERFGRHFYPSEHRHFDSRQEAAEILPWLQLSVELDPQRVETYTVTAYWLSHYVGRIDEAEALLRAGLRANPGSPEILFRVGPAFQRKAP